MTSERLLAPPQHRERLRRAAFAIALVESGLWAASDFPPNLVARYALLALVLALVVVSRPSGRKNA